MRVRMRFVLRRGLGVTILLLGLLAAAPGNVAAQGDICYDRTGKEIPCPEPDKPREPEPTPRPQRTRPPTAEANEIVPGAASPTATARPTFTPTTIPSTTPRPTATLAAAALPANSGQNTSDGIFIVTGAAPSPGGSYWDSGFIMLGTGAAALLLVVLLVALSRRKFIALFGGKATPASSLPQYNESDYTFLGERSQHVDGFQFNLTGHHMKPNASPGDLPLGTQAASSAAEGYPIKWPDLPPPEAEAHGFPIELTDASVADIEFESSQPDAPSHQHGGTQNANFATPGDTSSPDLALRQGGAQAQNQMGANILADNSMSADPGAAPDGTASRIPHELRHVVQGGSPADTTVHEVGHNIVTPGSHGEGQGTFGEDTLMTDASSTDPDSADETAPPPEDENPLS